MTNGSVSVSFTDLETAAKHLTNKQDLINQELSGLKRYISDLVASGFVTEKASVQFNATYGEFNNAAVKLMSSLANMAKYLMEAARSLRSLDEELAKRAQ